MPPTFPCPKCDAVFTRKNGMQCHLRTSRLHQDIPEGKAFCKTHKEWLPLSEFYPSQLRARVRLECKRHQNDVNNSESKRLSGSNPGSYNSRSARRSYWRNRIRVLLLLGGRCATCPESDVRVLQINHKNGGGSAEQRNRFTNKNSLHISIIDGTRSVDDLDLRCPTCNIRYEFERGTRRIPEGIEAEIRAEFEGKVLREVAIGGVDDGRDAGEHSPIPSSVQPPDEG